MKKFLKVFVLLASLSFPATAFAGGIPVVDAANLAQNQSNFVQELAKMAEQLKTAQQHVAEQVKEFESITGARGLETLLDGTIRNYIPDSWKDAINILNKPTGYADISGKAQEILQTYFNDPETNKAIEALPSKEREKVEKQRGRLANSAAMIETIYEEAEERTKAIVHLTAKIGDATDPKAMQELQAMIEAEQGHLQIAQNKMGALFQRLQVEQALATQQHKEDLYETFNKKPSDYKW